MDVEIMGVAEGVADSSVDSRVGVIGRGVKVGRLGGVAISRAVGVAVTGVAAGVVATVGCGV